MQIDCLYPKNNPNNLHEGEKQYPISDIYIFIFIMNPHKKLIGNSVFIEPTKNIKKGFILLLNCLKTTLLPDCRGDFINFCIKIIAWFW